VTNEEAAWQDQRRREVAQGARRHWGSLDQPRVRSQASRLREFQPEVARADVLCRRRLVARVVEIEPRTLQVALEAIGASGGQSVSIVMPDGSLSSGFSVTLLELGDVPILLGCRCRRRKHELEPRLLQDVAWRGRPGRPVEVGVSEVAMPAST
jgi:hypothetical protein